MRAWPVLLAALLSACSGGGSAGDAALAIFPASLPAATQGFAYSTALVGSGGTEEGYAWRLLAGTLPAGVGGLPASGSRATLSGTPAAAATFPLTVELRDSSGATVTADFTLVVGPSGGPGPGPGPGTGTWVATSLANAPAARSYHTAVWTGTEMIVWGGLDFLGVKNDGGAYDPATGLWRTLPTAGAPAARFGHTAAWTGNEMIVWGGADGLGLRGDGGAYRPSSNSWRTISSVSAPEARVGHTAVWSGTRMLVWGGEGAFAPPAPNAVDKVLGDGGAYDPVADAWSAIPAGGAPAARGHTAVWTGARMIVWAGRDGFALTLSTQNTGGAYEPVSGAWTLTDTLTAPSARMSHTAVWSGAEMIVWGGRTDVSPGLQTGGRYSFGSNSWMPTATVGAPSARHGHTAVWTGAEMLIWGGRGGTGIVGDGRAYDPAANTWRTLSTASAPAGRADHTAVWTGTAMILWGGAIEPADTYVNTGGILTP
jgi:N-acetylneuraminic acid mutarotase